MKRIICGIVLCLSLTGAGFAVELDGVRDAGVMSVAVYEDFAPFSDESRGIDREIATKLGEKLGVKVSFRPFKADENVDDDLRNMVWRGSLLGHGPADVMMHVPVQKEFAQRNERVAIFGAYFRDNLQIARNLERVPELRYLDGLANEIVGVEGDTLGADILASPSGGVRPREVRHYMDIQEAFADLKAGKLGAVLALGSQAQAAMGKEKGFAVELAPLHGRVPPAGWAFGLAVKGEREQLAQALKKAMVELEQDGTLDAIVRAHNVRRVRP